MDKAKICITKAQKFPLNASLKKQNLLVYEKAFPCVEPPKPSNNIILPPICKGNVKKIKVCTTNHLRMMRPIKLCDCPPQKPPLGIVGCLKALLGFGIKVGIAGGVIYWTQLIGLWGKTDGTKQLYVTLCNSLSCPSRAEVISQIKQEQRQISGKSKPKIEISEAVIDRQVKCCDEVPSIKAKTNGFKNCWNKLVVKSFDFIVGIPGMIGRVLKVPAEKDQAADSKNK